MDRLVRVNLSDQTVSCPNFPLSWAGLGGRALTSTIIAGEVPPGCDPLGAANKLVLAPGLLGGTSLSSSGRLSVGAKSPLTGGIKEANAGGTAGSYLAGHGIRAVIVEGAAQKRRYILHIGKEREPRLVEAGPETPGVYALFKQLRERWGDHIAVVCTGPAGVHRLRAAAVAASDPDFEARFAARGGLGAVMGAKGLLAVVVEKPAGGRRAAADRDKFIRAAREYNRLLLENPKTGKNFKTYGTASILNVVNSIGALPTRNFSSGSFEGAEKISGEALHELINKRSGAGRHGKRCMGGCVIACGNVVPDPGGKAIVSTLQYETLGMLGSNCGFQSLDDIARLNYLCNDLGLDTIEAGAALGVAMEAGLVAFGDLAGASRLLEEVRQGTLPGRVIGNGALVTGQVLGVERIPVSKGQAFPAYDPRGLKGNGVTYATSPMGADHTAGNTFGDRNKFDPLKPEGWAELSRELQIKAAVMDALGLCIFARPPLLASPELVVEMLNSLFGWDMEVEALWNTGRRLLEVEWAFNEREGLTAAGDRLPEVFSVEPLPPHQTVFDVDQADMARVRIF